MKPELTPQSIFQILAAAGAGPRQPQMLAPTTVGGCSVLKLLPRCLRFVAPAFVLSLPPFTTLHAQAPLPDGFNPEADFQVSALAVQPDGRILVGGQFSALGGQPRMGIGRLRGDGTLDREFNPALGGSAPSADALVVQADGKILVGGSFTSLGGQVRSNLARLNPDGTLDGTFNPGAGSTVDALAVQTDGKILVGGSFTSLGGQSRNRIGRLNADGTLDSGFNPAPNDSVYAITLQPDGKMLVGGAFTALGGQTRNRLARLNADGTLDGGFNPGVGGSVYSLALQADGKVLVAGSFTQLGGQTRNRLGRLNADGTLDGAFNPGANNWVASLAVQTDGKILVAGAFTTLGGLTRNRIGRLNADGTLDSDFNPGADDTVNSLAIQADGNILVSGMFGTLGGQPRGYLGRLNNTEAAAHSLGYDGATLTWLRSGAAPEAWRTTFDHSTDGLTWTSLGAGARMAGGWQLTGVTIPSGGTLRARGFVAGGPAGSGWFVEDYFGAPGFIWQPASQLKDFGDTATFEVVAGGNPPFGYQWLKDGAALGDGGQVSGARTPLLTVSNVWGGDAGGYRVVVTNSVGSRTSLVAQLTVNDPLIAVPPASQQSSVGQAASFSVTARGTPPFTYQWWHADAPLPGATSSTLALTDLQTADAGDYRAVVGNAYGAVTSAVATLWVNLATLDDAFSPGGTGSAYSLAVQPDGKVLVGGNFITLGGQTRNYLGRVNADGTLDGAFDPGPSSTVYSLVVQPDGMILAGGSFTTISGQGRNYLCRLLADGTLDSGFNPGAGNTVYSLAVQADGKTLVAGSFATLAGLTRNRIGRLNADGTLDAGFNPGANSTVYSLAVQPDGKILVGGEFTTLGGQTRNRIGRLNADGSLDSGFNPGASSTVHALAVQPDGKILVGGFFLTLGGQVRTNLGRLNPEGTLDSSFLPGANGTVRSFAIQADGNILIGGDFTSLGGRTCNRIGRLRAGGTPDGEFNPGAGSTVYSLAVQPDGKVLVGGAFTTLGGQTRNYLGRLHNTAPATQNLSCTGSVATWLRGGTSPEVWRTTFDSSTDGATWTSLGAGVRVAGGWQLSGVSIPPGGTLRARGFVTGAYDNACAWPTDDYWGRPVFVLHPVSQTNNAGETTSFRAVAGGSQPLAYQWFKDGSALADSGQISGARSPTLTLSDLLQANEGGYCVVVTNPAGSRTSSVAQLTVNDPYIPVSPASQSKELGQSATLSVTAVGTAPLSYQWWRNGLPVPGAAGSALALTNLQGADAGSYLAVVSNAHGVVTSAVALLTVNLITVDSGFNPGMGGTTPVVNALAVQGDGKILVGGGFTNLAAQLRNRLARLKADGTLDHDFNPGASHAVNALAVQADGRILVGGFFTNLAGQTRNRIARLNVDGVIDSTFNPAANDTVNALVEQADGKILVGGNFTTLGGQTRNRIGRLNADGTLDSGFNPGANSVVYSLALQPDGKILVGGNFTTLAGQARTYLGRLHTDGTLDTGFNPGPDYTVSVLAVQPEGKILVGGQFATLAGQRRYGLGRLHADGTLDSGFTPGDCLAVMSLALQADGDILVGGAFSTLGGQTRQRIGRLHADGTLDSRFNPGASGTVQALGVQADGKILVGGMFTTLNGQTRNALGRLDNTAPATHTLTSDGTGATWLRAGTSPEVWRATFERSTDGTTWTNLGASVRIAGGWQVAGAPAPVGMALRARGFVAGGYRNASGWLVEDYLGAPGFISQPAGQVRNFGDTATFEVAAGGNAPFGYQWLKDGAVLANGGQVSGARTPTLTVSNVWGANAGGYRVVVTNSAGTRTSLVAQLTVNDPFISVPPVSQWRERGDSVTFSVTAVGTPPFSYQWWHAGGAVPGATSSALALTNLQAADAGDYSAVVANSFSAATSAVATLTVSLATVDRGFNPGADDWVYALAVQTDGQILVGGAFTTLGGQTRNRLGRLRPDGALDSSFNPGADDDVYALVMQTDGKILVGGIFTNLAGQTRQRLGRLLADGTLDSGFNPGADDDVYALAVQPDGKILVGGYFNMLAGQTRYGLGRLNADGTIDAAFSPAANNGVYSLAVQADGKILVGGVFTTLGGQTRQRLGRLNADGTLDSGLNQSANDRIQSLAVQADGKILVGGYFTTLGGQARLRLGRLNAAGTLDSGFNPGAGGGVSSLAVQTDGKILVGGGFNTLGGQARTNLGRLNADGTLDSQFSLWADPHVYALAVQPDGKLLVGGDFTTLGGHTRSHLGRLNNSDPATQQLSLDGATVTWLRSGASPEVWRATLEYSTDGASWTSLGMGTRIAGGWQWPGSALPSGSVLRARGFVGGGLFNASGWFVESRWPAPLRLSLGRVSPSTFTLWLEGTSGLSAALQTTTNLPPAPNWQTLWAGVVTNGAVSFSWTNVGESTRYFRAHQP